MVKKVNQVEKIHASAVEKDVVDTTDGVAAVYQDKLPDIRGDVYKRQAAASPGPGGGWTDPLKSW